MIYVAGLKRFPTYEELFQDGKLVLDEANLKYIMNLVEVVRNKHFDLYPQYKEEFLSVGLEKVLKVLNMDIFDPSKGSLKNFLYTGIRNEMGNFLYHRKKDVVTDTLPVEVVRATDVESITMHDLVLFKKTLPSRLQYGLCLDDLYEYITILGLPTNKITKKTLSYDYRLNKISILFIKYYFDNLSR